VGVGTESSIEHLFSFKSCCMENMYIFGNLKTPWFCFFVYHDSGSQEDWWREETMHCRSSLLTRMEYLHNLCWTRLRRNWG
jgi:hypothetical protein